MGLKDIGETLPPGFRFYPSDEELVCHYLHKKIANEEALTGTLVDIDLHICEPWQLPEVAKLNGNEWYFFSFRDRKYATGYRTNRATTCGYWKATGKDRAILDPNTRLIVGMRKTLVFYKNRAPNGMKTGWIMHEFRSETLHMPPKEDWVLCRVFHKSKGESGHDNPHSLDTTTISISPTPTSVHLNTMAYNQQPPNSFASNPPNSQTLVHNYPGALDPTTMLNCSFNDSIMADCLSRNDRHAHADNGAHRYGGLLWEMGFEENNNNNLLGFGSIPHGHHQHHHHHEFYDMGFEDDNGVVFL